jgi:hypothetical protein
MLRRFARVISGMIISGKERQPPSRGFPKHLVG